ncbi:MAG: DoxX family protein [bacterium]
MYIAHIAVAVLMSLLIAGSGVAKLRRDPRVVKVINEVVRVPMKFFPWLAACEFAGGIGLLIGIAWPPIGLAAAVGLIIYFLGAIIAHVRVGDVKGIGAPAFMLGLAVACLVTRILSAYRG